MAGVCYSNNDMFRRDEAKHVSKRGSANGKPSGFGPDNEGSIPSSRNASRRSSKAEQRSFKPWGAGSTPAAGTLVFQYFASFLTLHNLALSEKLSENYD